MCMLRVRSCGGRKAWIHWKKPSLNCIVTEEHPVSHLLPGAGSQGCPTTPAREQDSQGQPQLLTSGTSLGPGWGWAGTSAHRWGSGSASQQLWLGRAGVALSRGKGHPPLSPTSSPQGHQQHQLSVGPEPRQTSPRIGGYTCSGLWHTLSVVHSPFMLTNFSEWPVWCQGLFFVSCYRFVEDKAQQPVKQDKKM